MAASHSQDHETATFGAQDVSVTFDPDIPSLPNNSLCRVELFQAKLKVSSEGNCITIPYAHIKSIEIHQPIFGANYISGKYRSQAGVMAAFTLTFGRGGATEFARHFFRLTEGQLTSSEAFSAEPGPVSPPQEDKKNQ